MILNFMVFLLSYFNIPAFVTALLNNNVLHFKGISEKNDILKRELQLFYFH
jgi:hypothetical protein